MGGASNHFIRAQQLFSLFEAIRGDAKLRREDSAQFLQYDFTNHEIMLGNDHAKQVRTEPASGERAHQHVRVENNPHDTSRNTSSSVR